MKKIRSHHSLRNRLKKSIIILLAIIIAAQPSITFANSRLPADQLDLHAQNNANFYNPMDGCGDTKGSCVAPTGNQLTIIADSLMAIGGEPLMKEIFPGADYGPEHNTANSYVQSGKQVGANGYGDANPDGLTVLERIVKEGKLRPYLIFALGANDPWKQSYVDRLLSLAGNDTQILLLTTKTIPPHTGDYTANNEFLKETASKYPNIHLGDWAAEVKDSYFDSGGLHYTAAGYRAYFEFIKSSIPQSCSAGLLSGNTTEERIWNYFVQKNIPGLSDNPAAISGILGNFYIESGYNPFMLGANPTYRGLYMLADIYGGFELRDKINAAVGKDYWKFYGWWGSEETVDKELAQVGASQNEIDTAITITLDYLTSTNDWKHFVDGLDQVENSSGTEGAGSYAELFEGLIEKAVDGGYYFHDSKVKAYVSKVMGYTRSYQGVEGRREAAQKAFTRLSSMTTSVTRTNNTAASSGGYTKYDLTDDQLWDLAEVAMHENDSNITAFKRELSIMANLVESPRKGQSSAYGGKYTPVSGDTLWSYVGTSGWFHTSRYINGKHDETVSSDRLDAARDVLINGNRVLPTQILEHDYIGDIVSATNNGEEVEKEEWKRGVTIIENSMGSRWVFYDWMGGEVGVGDPMGYFEDDPPTTSNMNMGEDVGECEDESTGSGVGGIAIAEAAVKMAWPVQTGQGDDTHANQCKDEQGNWIPFDTDHETCYHNPRDLYREQKQKFSVGGAAYEDCGWFAATVIYYVGADDNGAFPKGGADNMNNYMAKSDTWEQVTNDGTENNLMPGDVFASSNHIFIYVGDYGGTFGRAAEASLGTRVGIIIPWITANSGSRWRDYVSGEVMNIYRRKSSISENGLTYEEAKTFMMHYGENKENSSVIGLGNASGLWGICNGGGSNCVTFSAFFANKFTNIKFSNGYVGDGREFVGNLSGVEKGTEPKVFSIFSTGSSGGNHTGVILGREGDEWIVGNADCYGTGYGKGDGTPSGGGSGFVVKSSDLYTAQLSHNASIYAYPEVDFAAIEKYLETGL